MLLKRNLLECITIISCSGTLVCVFLNYVTNISPITGSWFHLYFLFVFVTSLFLSFKIIQWLLNLNKPFDYDIEATLRILSTYPWLSDFVPRKKKTIDYEYKEYDTNELSVISTVLEKRLVSSWYIPYISEEISFPFACKQMLDQMIGKTFEICHKLDTKDIFIDTCTVITSHLNEYKKAIKQHEEQPTTSVEACYRKAHAISDNKKYESTDHCTNILRVILKELIPYELWDTPHSELLIRILSKKLDSYIDDTLADPIWLNNQLLACLRGGTENVTVKTEKEEVVEATIEQKAEPTSMKINSTPNEVPNNVEKCDKIIEEKIINTEKLETKSSPVLRQRRGRQGRNEVKIYDRIIEESVKTWETDMDLQCISLGQDLLASLDGEITLSRLWGHEETEGSPNPPRRKSPPPLWFGEEDSMDMELTETSPREHKKDNSPKPTDAIFKDIQTAVHQAKTKIGDLQVPPNIVSVPRNFSDEAAGMMEGLLDFGIAGLKKGLRFTGLSDDSQEKSPSHHREKDKTPPTEGVRHKPHDLTAPVTEKEDNGSAMPPLVKQHRVISQDSVPVGRAAESPEPEYEEAADLSTSIAKLRSLLQQRADLAPRSEEVWWEKAEETRGRTQLHHSWRPVDTATLADEYDAAAAPDAGLASNNMQRLDKLFQRTVTGVFNSLRTAVGAEAEEPPGGGAQPVGTHEWTYVPAATDRHVGGAVARLLGGARAARVEPARDPLQDPPPRLLRTPPHHEDGVAGGSLAWAALAETPAALGLVRTHLVHRLAAVLLPHFSEYTLELVLERVSAWLRGRVFRCAGDATARGTSAPALDLDLDLDKTCAALVENIPKAVLVLFGEESLQSSVRLLVASFSHHAVNKDVAFRILDLLVIKFKVTAARNRTFDTL